MKKISELRLNTSLKVLNTCFDGRCLHVRTSKTGLHAVRHHGFVRKTLVTVTAAVAAQHPF
jgi:hypothetical protein